MKLPVVLPHKLTIKKETTSTCKLRHLKQTRRLKMRNCVELPGTAWYWYYTSHILMDTTSPLPETLDRRGQEVRRRHALLRSRTTIRLSEVPRALTGQPLLRVADFHVSLCQGEGAVLLARSGERALQPLQNSQSRTMPLGKVPAFAEPDIHSLSQAHGPSQKIEFVFAASPETIRREPREF